MHKLEDVYKRLTENKKKRSEINKMYKDELVQNSRHKELVEEIKVLRDEKKSIETEIKEDSREFRELEDLKIDIETDQELLSDIALNMYTNKEIVEIVDEYDNKWYPVFRVAFKKE
ncbi:MAG: hypothetical protein ABIA47_00555 [bacterium]